MGDRGLSKIRESQQRLIRCFAHLSDQTLPVPQLGMTLPKMRRAPISAALIKTFDFCLATKSTVVPQGPGSTTATDVRR
jgi:hypothetical protein